MRAILKSLNTFYDSFNITLIAINEMQCHQEVNRSKWGCSSVQSHAP